MTFTDEFLAHCLTLLERLDGQAVEQAAAALADVRAGGGRVFVLGSGGGAAHASHAACDLRKLCDIEAYAPYDNVAELTARVNDEGWETSLSSWLSVSRLRKSDALLVFSVGGGSLEERVSVNLVNACQLAQDTGARIIAVVGRGGGYCARVAAVTILLPEICPELVTPLTEGFQSVIWHLLVSHPLLGTNQAKWESLANRAGTQPSPDLKKADRKE